jgi:hypothetical protein
MSARRSHYSIGICPLAVGANGTTSLFEQVPLMISSTARSGHSVGSFPSDFDIFTTNGSRHFNSRHFSTTSRTQFVERLVQHRPVPTCTETRSSLLFHNSNWRAYEMPGSKNVRRSPVSASMTYVAQRGRNALPACRILHSNGGGFLVVQVSTRLRALLKRNADAARHPARRRLAERLHSSPCQKKRAAREARPKFREETPRRRTVGHRATAIPHCTYDIP